MKHPRNHPKHQLQKAKHVTASMIGTSGLVHFVPVFQNVEVLLVTCAGILAIYVEDIAHYLEGKSED